MMILRKAGPLQTSAENSGGQSGMLSRMAWQRKAAQLFVVSGRVSRGQAAQAMQ